MTAIKLMTRYLTSRLFMWLFLISAFLFYDYAQKVSQSLDSDQYVKDTLVFKGYNKAYTGVSCLYNSVGDFFSGEDEVSPPEDESENTESKIDVLDIEPTEKTQEVISTQDLGKGSFLTEDGHIGTIID